MGIAPTFNDLGDWLALKPEGYFIISRWGTGWAITIRRTGCPLETILCKTPAETNAARLKLSDEGLCGYVGGSL